MESAKVSSQGQITLPKVIREALQVVGGDTVVFVTYADRVEILKKSPGLLSLAGRLQPATPLKLTIDEINDALGNPEWKQQ